MMFDFMVDEASAGRLKSGYQNYFGAGYGRLCPGEIDFVISTVGRLTINFLNRRIDCSVLPTEGQGLDCSRPDGPEAGSV
jgi:hypothetical protein